MDASTVEKLKKIESKLQDFDFPPQIVIETTSYCNFKCVHCNHKELKRPQAHMDRAIYEKVVSEIARENPETEVWPTFYGEAFILGDRLFEMLEYARDKGLKNLVLNSNGSLLGRKDWSERILKCGLKRFILSLDGFSKEVFESVRKGGKRDQVYGDLENLFKLKEKLGLEYPVIQCQFSLMECNQHEFPEFKEFWEARGAEVKSRNMLSWTNSGSVQAENLDYQSNFRIACPWGNNTMAIHQSGDVVACAVDYEGNYVGGNVADMTISEIWNGPLKELRTLHRKHQWDKLPALCQACPDWQTAGATYHEKEGAEVKEYTRPFWTEAKKQGESSLSKAQ